MSDEKKEIKLYEMENIHLIPNLNVGAVQYHKDEIERLTGELFERHKEYMEMSKRLDTHRVKYLEKFRAYFCYHCIALGREVDLLTCRDTIAEARCLMSDVCKPRNSLIEKLHLDDGSEPEKRNPSDSTPIF